MKRIMTIAALAALMLMAQDFAAAPGRAAESRAPVVVELFTSQGCSSCPPADAFLGELAQRKDVIALAYHVDYWDYIGWKDRLRQPRLDRSTESLCRRPRAEDALYPADGDRRAG
jgi:hypothetical protein